MLIFHSHKSLTLGLFFFVFLVFNPRPLEAEEGILQVGLGLSWSQEQVTRSDNTGTTSLGLSQLLGEVSVFQGSEVYGGLTWGLQAGTAYEGSWANRSFAGTDADVLSASVGYDFFVPWGKSSTLRFGPCFLGTLTTVSLSTTGSAQTSFDGVSWGPGLGAQVDWHPFSTGIGIIDGLFCYMDIRAHLIFPGFPHFRFDAVPGIGLVNSDSIF